MKFPIIALKENDNLIYFLGKENNLLITTESLLKERFFDHSEFIDSDGNVFVPVNASKIGYTGFWGFNPLLKDWLTDRQIKIVFEYANDVKKIELSVLKERLIKRVNRSKTFWEAAWDIDELISEIQGANSFDTLIPLFK